MMDLALRSLSIHPEQYSESFPSGGRQLRLSGCIKLDKIPSDTDNDQHFLFESSTINYLSEHQAGYHISVPPDSPGPMSSQCWRDPGFPGCWVDPGIGRNAKCKAKHKTTSKKAGDDALQHGDVAILLEDSLVD